jgi:hypothetical protein
MKKIMKMMAEFFTILIIGCLMLIAVYVLPDKGIKSHIKESAEWLISEGDYPYMGIKEQAYLVDNWTEAMLLLFNYTADGSKPIYSAFVATTYMPENSTGISRLNDVINDQWQENEEYIGTRGTNWMGYNVFLRLGLMLFTISELRVILNVVSYSVLLLTICILFKYLGGYSALGFGLTMLCYNFYALSISWTLGVFCVMIACMVIIYVLKYNGNIDYLNLMFVTGILTSYFEWLSIPLVTWGLPTSIILLMHYKKETQSKFKSYFSILLKTGIGWCLGYILMTLSKTAIAFIVQGKEAWDFFLERLTTDTSGMNVGEFTNAVWKLIGQAFPFSILPEGSLWIVRIAMLGFLLQVSLVVCYKRRRAINLAYFLICFSPIVYYIYARGHIHHVAIEFRSLMILYFAAWLMFEPIYETLSKHMKCIAKTGKKNEIRD